MKARGRTLQRGRDWHGWAWKWSDGGLLEILPSAHPERERPFANRHGRYVRVKFVEVRVARPTRRKRRG